MTYWRTNLYLVSLQDSLFSKIASDDSICVFLKPEKSNLKLKKRKLLGIKPNVNYDAIGTYGGNKRYKSKDKGQGHRSKSCNSGDYKFCGTQHPPRKCAAYGQQCHKCNGKNHFGWACHSPARSQSHDKSDKHQFRSKGRPKSKNFYKVILTMKDNMMTMMLQNCRNMTMLKH